MFLRAVAALLQPLVQVEGSGSSEWKRAIEILVLFSDGSVSVAEAERLLRDASAHDVRVSHLDEEDRLVLLRVAIEVALGDGEVSPKEVAALEVLAARLGLGAQVVHVLIERITGSKAGTGHKSEVDGAFRVLGVKSGASSAEIRSAYKQMMKEHHPDRVPPEKREAATRKAAEINDAYDLLIGRSKKSGMSSSGASGTRPPQSDQPAGTRRSGTSSTTAHTSQCVKTECKKQLPKTAKFCGACGHPQT